MPRIRKSTNNAKPAILATLIWILACIPAPQAAIIIFIIVWPASFFILKGIMGEKLDELIEEDTKKIIETSRRQRDSSINIEQTLYSGGLFNIPMTRKTKVKFRDSDFKE